MMQMDPKKFVSTFLIASTVLFGAYFVVQKRSQIGQTVTKAFPSLEGVLSDKEGEMLGEGGEYEQGNAGKNFTELFGGALAQQLINQNAAASGQLVNTDKLLSDQAIEDFLDENISQKNNTNKLHPRVYSAKYTISEDVSKEAQLRYLEQLSKISQEKSKRMQNTSADILAEVTQSKNGDAAAKAAGVYGDIADAYGHMVVPRNWVEFHKKLLTHFYSAQSVYDAIAKFEQDPMKAYLAIQTLPELDRSSLAIQTLVAQGMKQNNLHL